MKNVDDTTTVKDFNKRNRICKLLITGALADSHLVYAKEVSHAYEILNRLDRVYREKGTASRVSLKREWQNLKLPNSGDLNVHLRKFDDITTQLRQIGVKLEEKDVVEQLLMSLGPEYDTIVQILESKPDITTEEVKQAIRNRFEKLNGSNEKRNLESAVVNEGNNVSFLIRNNNNSNNNNSSYRRSFRSKFNNRPIENFRGQNDRPVGANEGNRFQNQQGQSCFSCGRIGHRAFQCRGSFRGRFGRRGSYRSNYRSNYDRASYIDEKHTGTDSSNNIDRRNSDNGSDSFFNFLTCCNFGGNVENGKFIVFYIDSGASWHYINDLKYFQSYKRIDKEKIVKVCKNGVGVKVNVRGVMRCKCNGINIEMKDVFYSKDFPVNLLSVKRLNKNGISVNFHPDQSVTLNSKTGKLIAKGQATGDDLFKIKFEVTNKCERAFIGNDSNKNVKLWHSRLGHPSFGVMRKIEFLGGLNINDSFFCEGCQEGKQTKLPHPPTGSRSKKILEMIHSDLIGPFNNVSFNGFKYVLTFTDDYSGFITIYLLKFKSEVIESFKEYFWRTKRMFNYGINEIRCDNGTEYTNREFRNFCREKGIRIGYTIPYTPQMNGKAERIGRTLMDKARTLLVSAGLEGKYWSEAMLCAAFLTNRVPNCYNVIPAKLWYDKDIRYDRFRVFGCNAYLLTPKQKRENKFEPKSKKYILVGYDWSGYRLLDEENNNVLIGRDVVFDESGLGFMQTEYDEDISQLFDLKNPKNENSEKCVFKEAEDECSHYAYGCFDENPKTYMEAVESEESGQWKTAIQDELNAFRTNDVWQVVDRPKDKKVLTTRWLFRRKEDGRFKARLVARGYEDDKRFDTIDTYSPVAKMSTVRLLLSLSLRLDCPIRQVDIKNAYLNSDLDSPIYIELPEGYEIDYNKFNDPVLRVSKAMYGLKESGKRWNEEIDRWLSSLGFIRNKFDECLYHKDNMFILVYVDDMLIVINDRNYLNSVIGNLKRKFKCTDLGSVKSFLGLEIDVNSERGILKFNQSKQIEMIAREFRVTDSNFVHTPIEEKLCLSTKAEEIVDSKLPKLYRRLLGKIMYVMLGSRPDVCYSVSLFSQFQNSPNRMIYNHLLRVLKYLWHTRELFLVYHKYEKLNLQTFVDADWANCPTSRKSISGICCFLSNNLIAWKSRKQSIVTLSSSDAEIIALCEGTCETLSIKNILNEFSDEDVNIEMFEDNANCIYFAYGCTKKSKHLEIKYYFIRDYVRRGIIRILSVPSSEQVADIMTKGLGPTKFSYFRDRMRISAT